MSTSRNTQIHVPTNSSGSMLSGLTPTWLGYLVSTDGAAYSLTTGSVAGGGPGASTATGSGGTGGASNVTGAAYVFSY